MSTIAKNRDRTIPKCGPSIAVCIDKSRVYGAGVLQGLADYLEIHGPWSVLVESFSNGELPWNRLEHWDGHGILALLCTKRAVKQIAELGIPAVDLCGGLEPNEYAVAGIPCVTSDQHAIGKLAAEHLIDNGYKNLAFSGFRRLNWVEDRWRGFSECASNLTCERHTYLMPMSQSGESTRDLAERDKAQQHLAEWLLNLPKPVGIFACNDSHAIDLLDVCRRQGILVPDEVGVIGVDNDETLCRLSKPPLSSVTPDARRIGYQAAQTLHALMSGRELHDMALISPIDVAARLSTQGTAVADEAIAAALRFIRENVKSGINVTDVQRASGLSRKLFFDRFQENVGRTPHDEISRMRVREVKRLLRESKLSLEKIANLTGYCSAAHMTEVFKLACGTPPGEFRRNFLRTQ